MRRNRQRMHTVFYSLFFLLFLILFLHTYAEFNAVFCIVYALMRNQRVIEKRFAKKKERRWKLL